MTQSLSKSRTFIALAAASILALAAPFATAFAGSNGQQIVSYKQASYDLFCPAGYNQDSVWVDDVCWNHFGSTGTGVATYGYWWKWTVNIYYYNNPNWVGQNSCEVPVSWGTDLYTCTSYQ